MPSVVIELVNGSIAAVYGSDPDIEVTVENGDIELTRRVVHNRCAVYGCRRPLDYSQRSSADNRSVIDPFGIDLYLPAISYLHISCSSLRHFWRDVGSAVFCTVGHGGGSLHLVPNFSKSWKPHSSLCCFMRIRSGNRL